MFLDGGLLQICGPYRLGGVGYDLPSREDSPPEKPANHGWADVQRSGRLLQGEQSLPLAAHGVMNRDLVIVAQADDPARRPTVPF